MRYRKLDANGDYTFGHSGADFLVNTPETVAQAVLTRLRLWQGEWFLDTSKGTPYLQQVLGSGTWAIYDQALKEVILNTQGVTGIAEYTSTFNDSTRAVSVAATIDTLYGQTTVTLNPA